MKIADLIALLQQCDPDAAIVPAYRDAADDFMCMLYAEPIITRRWAGVYFLNVQSSLIESLIKMK